MTALVWRDLFCTVAISLIPLREMSEQLSHEGGARQFGNLPWQREHRAPLAEQEGYRTGARGSSVAATFRRRRIACLKPIRAAASSASSKTE